MTAASAPRLIVANLDVESEWARDDAVAQRAVAQGAVAQEAVAQEAVAQGRRSVALSRSVLERIAAIGTAMRCFARDGDLLWTPRPVDPAAIAAIPGLAQPEWISGPSPARGFSRVLAWGESAPVARMRAAARDDERASVDGDLASRLWALTPARPETAARSADRRFAIELGAELGEALPGAAIVATAGELARHIEGTRSRWPSESWVVKARWSASGRDRFVHHHPELPASEDGRRRIESLFARFGALVFEPWVERCGDFGTLVLASDDIEVIGTHVQEVDAAGRLRALRSISSAADITAGELEDLHRVATLAGERALTAGYSGPLGVDSWRYRAPDGSTRIHALGEINPRLSLGWILRVLDAVLPGGVTRLALDGSGREPLVESSGGPRVAIDRRTSD